MFLTRDDVYSHVICACIFEDSHETKDMLLEWDSVGSVEHVEELDLPQFKLVSESNSNSTEVYKTGELGEHLYHEAWYSRKVRHVYSSCKHCAKFSSRWNEQARTQKGILGQVCSATHFFVFCVRIPLNENPHDEEICSVFWFL